MTLTSLSTACWVLRNCWRWGVVVKQRCQFLRREGRLYCFCCHGRNSSGDCFDIHGHCTWGWTWRVWSNHVVLLSCSPLMISGRLLRTQSWPPGSLVGANGWNGGGRCSLSCWSFSRRHLLENILLKLAKVNKTRETINTIAGDTNIPRELLSSGKLLSTWERQFEIYTA